MDRPILFSAPMIRALLAGRKTQTRRAIKSAPVNVVSFIGADNLPTWEYGLCLTHDRAINKHVRCPYGQPGDQLWVREAFRFDAMWDARPPRDVPRLYGGEQSDVFYEARAYDWGRPGRLRPGMFMPRWASRITLNVTDVRVQRLNDTSEADATAEGSQEPSLVPLIGACWSERDAYAKLWEHINGPGSWEANPWVWAVSFTLEGAQHAGEPRAGEREANAEPPQTTVQP
jgi:hypothetical protein